MKQRTDKFFEKEEENSKMLSFHPQLSMMTTKIARKDDLQKDVWSDLYRQSTTKNGKRDLSEDEIEFERNRGEYTFQPNSHKYQSARVSVHL